MVLRSRNNARILLSSYRVDIACRISIISIISNSVRWNRIAYYNSSHRICIELESLSIKNIVWYPRGS